MSAPELELISALEKYKASKKNEKLRIAYLLIFGLLSIYGVNVFVSNFEYIKYKYTTSYNVDPYKYMIDDSLQILDKPSKSSYSEIEYRMAIADIQKIYYQIYYPKSEESFDNLLKLNDIEDLYVDGNINPKYLPQIEAQQNRHLSIKDKEKLKEYFMKYIDIFYKLEMEPLHKRKPIVSIATYYYFALKNAFSENGLEILDIFHKNANNNEFQALRADKEKLWDTYFKDKFGDTMHYVLRYK